MKPSGRNGNQFTGPIPDPSQALAVAVINRRRRAAIRARLRKRELGWTELMKLADADPVIGRLFVADCIKDMRGRMTPASIQLQLPRLRAHPKLRLSKMGQRQRNLVLSWWP